MCALLSGMTSDHIFLDLFVSFFVSEREKARPPAHALGIESAVWPYFVTGFFFVFFFFSQERALSASGSTKNVITLSKTGMKAP